MPGGEKPAFVAGLEGMGQPFVLEVPRDLMGWSHAPAAAGDRRSKAEDLCRHSPAFTGRPWKPYHVKDTTTGPMVWEAGAASFWTKRDGKVIGPYRLMAARGVLGPDTVKYFLSDATDAPERVTLHVGLSRWPVERRLEDEKSASGLSHFECRKYPAVRRHLLVTQVSHLFLARQATRLRGDKRHGARDHLPGPRRRRGPAGGLAAGRGGGRPAADRPGRGQDPADPDEQRRGPKESHQGPPPKAPGLGHPARPDYLLHPAVTAVAL